MTIPISPASTPSARVVSSLSRYRKQPLIYYGDQKFITFETYLRKPYVRKGDESVMVITKGVEYRPDLVAFDVYGVPDVWWRIMEVNGIKDIFDFRAGRTIFLPNDVF